MPCELGIEDLLHATQGESLSVYKNRFTGVSTDSRHVKGEIFFALIGEKFDAHNFLAQAVDGGAQCLIVHRETPDLARLKSRVTVVRVSDTLRALQELARAWRRRLPRAKIFGVTGSNGKSSTKEFAATILEQEYKVSVSYGSFNNHWGVPLTLLESNLDDQAVIVEMGMNHAGELTQLSKIVEPDVVLCTTVGRALDQDRTSSVPFDVAIFTNLTREHLDYHKTMDEYFRAKEKLFRPTVRSTKAMTAILNVDDEWARRLDIGQGIRRWTYGEGEVNVVCQCLSPR